MPDLRMVKAVVLILMAPLFWVSCSLNEAGEARDFTVTNNEESLSERLKITDTQIEVDTTTGQSNKLFKKRKTFDLKLIAELDAPEVNGTTIQATMVSILGSSPRAAVSYNQKGAGYTGAIDIIQLPSGNNGKLRLRSGVTFNHADANAVFLNTNRVWTALATENPKLVDKGEFSALRRFSFSGFSIADDSEANASLPGFAANSTKEYGGNVYVTSGDNAGLSVFDLDLSEQIAFIEIADARWVDVNDQWVVVLTGGSNGGLHKYDRESLELIERYDFEGAETAEAKNTVEIVGELALIAEGKSGVQIMNLNNGNILANIPIPDPNEIGLSPDVVATNAVSAEEEYIFISNGEAGVYVAEANTDLNSYRFEHTLEVDLIGKLIFDENQSVNHISYRNKHLIVASGLGGVKAVQLSRK